MENLGITLKHLRELKGLTQLELSKQIGTSHQNINRWERGIILPSIDFCARLADFYNITLDELISGSNFPTYPQHNETNNIMNYGQALKEQREISGYTQNALAKATGISQPKISYYESGQHTPPIDHCVTLAQLYGITVDELIGLSDTPRAAHQTPRTLPSDLPNKAVAFVNEYGELLDDGNFKNTAKLFQAITPELRALALGYLVGLLQNNGINTKKILGY